MARVKQIRQDRNVSVSAALERLREVCATDENVMPAVLECVQAYATTGEISQVWRDVFGNYSPETIRY